MDILGVIVILILVFFILQYITTGHFTFNVVDMLAYKPKILNPR